mmetsp:Transcript_30154/g.65167  ORF Transcript_30154/g.65167 Transcript_30154/m.65167 type:complete len:84 (-) Transcript_30154:511-762(-)
MARSSEGAFAATSRTSGFVVMELERWLHLTPPFVVGNDASRSSVGFGHVAHPAGPEAAVDLMAPRLPSEVSRAAQSYNISLHW